MEIKKYIKENYKKIIYLLILILMVFLLGRYSVKPIIKNTITEKVIIDTLIVEKPIPDTIVNIKYIEKILPRVIEKTDTLIVKDSIKVYVPINKYIFEEPDKYKIEASGYEVSLDKVELYPKTIYKTETKTIKTKPKFGIGIHVGYGICGNRFSPYVGIGISYNIITF